MRRGLLENEEVWAAAAAVACRKQPTWKSLDDFPSNICKCLLTFSPTRSRLHGIKKTDTKSGGRPRATSSAKILSLIELRQGGYCSLCILEISVSFFKPPTSMFARRAAENTPMGRQTPSRNGDTPAINSGARARNIN